MEMLLEVFGHFWNYVREVFPFLVLGFFLSGLIQVFIPSNWISKYLGGSGFRPLFYATVAGTVLPICCIGSLPVAISLHDKGARLGPVLSFLVATPATSLSALFVSYGLLGLQFTVYLFLSVIVLGLLMGLVGNQLRFVPPAELAFGVSAADPVCGMQVDAGKPGVVTSEYDGTSYYFCCDLCRTKFGSSPAAYAGGCVTEACSCAPRAGNRAVQALRHSFITMPREIGPEILLGLALAAIVAAVTPIGRFVGEYFAGGLAFVIALPAGILMYTCSTASVPLIHALVTQGMNTGAGMLLLIVGPVTSWSTILVLRKQFGTRMLVIYLAVISVLSLAAGLLYTLL